MNSGGHWQRASYLLSAVGAATSIRFTELLAPIGLQPAHFGVLRRLLDNEGSSQQEIADAARVRRSVMVGLIDELESRGWVERRRHPVDRRANALHLTPEGRHALASADQSAQQLDEELLAAIPAQARAGFLEHLQRLGIATGVADGVYPVPPDDRTDTPRRVLRS